MTPRDNARAPEGRHSESATTRGLADVAPPGLGATSGCAVIPELTPLATLCRPSGAPASASRTSPLASPFVNPTRIVALIALQNPPAPKAKASARVRVDDPPAKKGGIRLPKSITTQIELEDVDLKTLVDRASGMGIHIPVPVAGRLSLKATATIPLGNLRDIKDYTFRGDATLTAASIAGVDLGHVQARLALDKGVLDLTDFRGQLVDLPDGGVKGRRPEATAPVPAQGPLPPGGFAATCTPNSPRRAARRRSSRRTPCPWGSWPPPPCPGRPRSRAI